MVTRLEDMIEQVKGGRRMRLALAAAEDYDALKSVVEAAKLGIVEPVLIGDRKAIEAIADEHGFDLGSYERIGADSPEESAAKACELVAAGKADFLMKGLLDTSVILKAVLNKDYGLRTDSLLSHVMVYESPFYHKLLFLTDGGMNIAPDVSAKKSIICNAVKCAKALGVETVKVAVLAAKEKVSEKMQATVDADQLAKLSGEGEFGSDVMVEGPLALDLAVSNEAAAHKGFRGRVAGDVDILLVHEIGMGNGIGKALTYLGGAKSAGVIMGARVPIVLTSRADTAEVKLYSIALGSLCRLRETEREGSKK